MDITANNQLVPYSPGPIQVIPYTLKSSRTIASSGEPASRRYALLLPPFYPKTENQPDHSESAYNSSRRLVTPKINQTGLLIDIYA
jgi:hypothetical protein